MNILEIKELKKTYCGREILNIENFKLQKGKKIAIIGESGSGKSTFLNAIIKSIEVDSGSISVCNTEITTANDVEMSALRAKDIGVIYQNANLLSDFTIYQNIKIAKDISRNYNNNNDDKEYINQSLSKVGLESKANDYPNDLSGGEMQRVSIARAMITSPELIIADEPTGNLDDRNAESIVDLFLSLDSAVIMVTHNRELANRMQEVYELKNKKLIKVKNIKEDKR